MRKVSADLWKSKQGVTHSLKLALSFAVVKNVIGLCLKPRISRIICYFHHLIVISKVVRGERASDHPSLMCPLGVPGAVFVAFRFLINAMLLHVPVHYHDLVTHLSSTEPFWFFKVSQHACVQLALPCKAPRSASLRPAQSQPVWWEMRSRKHHLQMTETFPRAIPALANFSSQLILAGIKTLRTLILV